MYFFPTVVIDDFLKDPFYIRDYALSLEYFKGVTYSGTRTENLFLTNEYLANQLCKKILVSCGLIGNTYKATAFFHLTGEEFGDQGWPHRDFDSFDPNDDTVFASVIYLSPDARGLKSGTSLFKYKTFENPYSYVKPMRESFASEKDNLIEKKACLKNYDETIRVGGAFNRVIAYDARKPHCGNEYFGSNKEEKRLTMIAFFTDITTNLPKSYTPITYADMMSDI